MKIRNLGLPLVLIGLLSGLAPGPGGAKLRAGEPNSVLHPASAVASPLLLAAPSPLTSAALQRALPLTGPSPVNLLSAGLYLGNYRYINTSGLLDLAFGDFTGDGKQDIVVVDGSTYISVMPGNGKGQFSTAGIDSGVLPSGGGQFVVAGDFNKDGRLDVAVLNTPCCPEVSTLMLAQGNGDGTFTYTNSVSLSPLGYGETIKSLNAADLNNDGNLDLVVTTISGNIFILLGDGSFGFTQSELFGNGYGDAPGAAIADFNQDGNLDLAVPYGAPYDNYVSVLLGNGDGTFQTPVNYALDLNQGGTSDIASGDVNGDGILDIVVNTSNSISVLLGVGNGTFQPVIDSPSVANTNFLAVGDFNGDGMIDAVVSSNYGGGGDTVGVLLSNGDGTFAPLVEYAVITAPGRVRVADLNGDGHPDWVAISPGYLYLSVGLGSGEGTFLAAVNYPSTPGYQGTTTAIAAADFNKDGKLDYATVGWPGITGVNISLGDGAGNFAAPVNYPAGGNPLNLTTGDLNHDGYPDIAVLDQYSDTVSVLLNNGNGTFASAVGYAVGSGSGLIQTGDFNHDGNLDLIVTNYNDGTVSVLLGNANGTFQSQKVSPTQANGYYMTIGDFNGDGKLDVAVDYYYSTTISILLGNGDGTFQAPLSATGPSQNTGLAAGDFNKDGKADLAVASDGINNGSGGYGGVAILLGMGSGSFQAPVNYPTVPVGLGNAGASVRGPVRLGDLNNDGNLDIVAPNYLSIAYEPPGYLYAATQRNLGPAILLGNGDGTFTLNPANAAVAGINQGDVALGDFNHDGSLDVAVMNIDPGNGNPTLNTVSMLLSAEGTEVVLTSAPNPSFQGQPVTFTATVITSFPNLPIPTGTITFKIGATNVPVTMVNGTATYTTSTLPVGKTQVFAAYSGDANFNPKTSLGLLQTVKPAVLRISTTSLPDAVQNVSYNATVTAAGGTPPYTFSITTGTLPAGLSMSTGGVISGTPSGLPGTSSFTVQVQDSGSPIQTATANLSITVASNLVVTTTSVPNGVVGNSYSATVTASGGIPPYTFTISSGSLPAGLSISAGGVISGTPSGPSGTSTFTVQVQDSASPAQTATASLSITITGALTITTTSLPNGVEGSPYSASVTASGGIPPYTFTISSGTLPNGLSISTSGVISGTPTIPGTSNFTVKATDSSSPAQTATANLSITVTSNLTITTTSLPTGVVGNSYSATITASGGNPPYIFALASGSLPAGLSLSRSGLISGTPSSPGTSNFAVKVKDSSSPAQTATANLSITVTGPLTITTTSLPNATEGTSYSATVTASGGITPYTFSISSGTLPPGLSISTSGVISGTPTGAGTSNFTVQATDSSSPAQTATANLSITVISNLTITTTSLPNGVVGNSYSATITASGGHPPYTFSITSGSLPAGLSLSASGVISGTPTGAGTSNFTVQVQDSSTPAQTATANLSITVTGPLTITTTSLPPGVFGVPYSATVTASGGIPPYTFSIISGSLLGGLSMSTSGVISGTPSGLGTSNFTVQVKDSSHPAQKSTAKLSITVSNTLMIITTSLPDAVEGTQYKATLTASGGTQPYTFSLPLGGGLPQGLSLSSNGVISGKVFPPNQTFNFTVQVTDSSNPVQTATANLSITVYSTFAITTTALPGGVAGSPYRASVTAKGGTQPYSFAVISGSLPAGLVMGTSGAITGTPSGSIGTFNFTVQVADSSVPIQTATANLSITISSNFMITTVSVPNGQVGVPYSTQIMASGGTPPYLFALSGPLPTGLSLSEGGVLYGTPSKATNGSAHFGVFAFDSSFPRNSTFRAYMITIAP